MPFDRQSTFSDDGSRISVYRKGDHGDGSLQKHTATPVDVQWPSDIVSDNLRELEEFISFLGTI